VLYIIAETSVGKKFALGRPVDYIIAEIAVV